ncbi:lamina-associated polypeptide 2, isoforms beta/gamma-like isoform X2 [Syngnathus scovelli]|uniref:lamina-associated polypeptide 2, isoforms beta/gamma-like isoform X2 n=1 Tax=Syngnathus scovelli TaxID=161590 RepID=UPI0021107729|nr:lamina-associated polypeptide 2, isoforms beta/gamma-like isoform X2 [Syngnathus scovelli]
MSQSFQGDVIKSPNATEQHHGEHARLSLVHAVQDPVQLGGLATMEEKPNNGQKRNLSMLTDDDLKAALLAYGVTIGPIVGSTRAVYERKLRRLQAKWGTLNGEEKVHHHEWEDKSSDDSDSGSSLEEEPMEEYTQHDAACGSRNSDLCHKPTLEKVSKSTQSDGPFVVPEDTSGASSLDQNSGLGSQVSEQSIQDPKCSSENFTTENDEESDILVAEPSSSQYFVPKESSPNQETKGPKKDLLPDIEPTSTRFSATCRRPIKGAAGRPKQLSSPSPPISPTTKERSEIEHRMVPIHIQFVVFVVVALLLFVIVESEPLSPFLALTQNFMQGFINDAPVLQCTQTFRRHE